LKTNAWIENLDTLCGHNTILSKKNIYAVNEQTLGFEFIFLIWHFCPLSCWSQTNIQMTKKFKDR